MRKKYAVITVILIVLLSSLGFSFDKNIIADYFNSFFNVFNSYFDISDEDLLLVNFIDVGQGDCTVIILPDEKVIMIDSGDNGHEEEVFEFLDDNNISKIDYLIATHPHSDHIGGIPEVIENYDIGEVYMPQVLHNSTTFEKMIDELINKNLKIHTAKAGKSIIGEKDLQIDFISPVSDEYEELNNYSAAVKLVYGKKSFIFCGDMEIISENEVLNSNYDIDADVLKVAHHGSSTSSSADFLNAVSADIAIISCGENNEYNHPHKEIINRLNKYCDTILRTDKDGTITIKCDGEKITYSTEK